MIDIQKHINYWTHGAAEDMDVAYDLIYKDTRTLHGLFFIHLSLEKWLKAIVCKTTNDIPPKIHDLLRLAELGNINLTSERRDFLGKMNLYNIAGRYPDEALPKPSMEKAKNEFDQAGRLIEWLKKML
jgi:HEPN domain-containing protein